MSESTYERACTQPIRVGRRENDTLETLSTLFKFFTCFPEYAVHSKGLYNGYSARLEQPTQKVFSLRSRVTVAADHFPPLGRKARPWLSKNPGKRWTEVFYLAYSPFWIGWALCGLVPLKLYERCNSIGYLAIGLAAAIPCIALPMMLQSRSELSKPWHKRYWVKANLWIGMFSFIGNYFWTHYFFSVLGASYHFPSWELNRVPITLYFMTHAYFHFYHSISNICLRTVKSALRNKGRSIQIAGASLTVFLLAYSTAYMETLTIAHFPYYRFKDKARMYTTGSLFYAMYFFVSFPVYFYLDENPKTNCSAARAIADSLASGMAVTILLDLWRLYISGGENPQSLNFPWLQR